MDCVCEYVLVHACVSVACGFVFFFVFFFFSTSYFCSKNGLISSSRIAIVLFNHKNRGKKRESKGETK